MLFFMMQKYCSKKRFVKKSMTLKSTPQVYSLIPNIRNQNTNHGDTKSMEKHRLKCQIALLSIKKDTK